MERWMQSQSDRTWHHFTVPLAASHLLALQPWQATPRGSHFTSHKTELELSTRVAAPSSCQRLFSESGSFISEMSSLSPLLCSRNISWNECHWSSSIHIKRSHNSITQSSSSQLVTLRTTKVMHQHAKCQSWGMSPLWHYSLQQAAPFDLAEETLTSMYRTANLMKSHTFFSSRDGSTIIFERKYMTWGANMGTAQNPEISLYDIVSFLACGCTTLEPPTCTHRWPSGYRKCLAFYLGPVWHTSPFKS